MGVNGKMCIFVIWMNSISCKHRETTQERGLEKDRWEDGRNGSVETVGESGLNRLGERGLGVMQNTDETIQCLSHRKGGLHSFALLEQPSIELTFSLAHTPSPVQQQNVALFELSVRKRHR